MVTQTYVNLIPNPRAALNVDDWWAARGTADTGSEFPMSEYTDLGGPLPTSPSYGFIEHTGNGSSTWLAIIPPRLTTATPGQTITFSGYGWVHDPGHTLQARIFWLDADGFPIGREDYYSAPVDVPGNQWTRVQVTSTAPAGTASAAVSIRLQRADGAPLETLTFGGSAFAAVPTEGDTYSGVYFDGSIVSTETEVYGWYGEPHDSASYMTVTLETVFRPMSIATAVPVPEEEPSVGVVPREFKRLQLHDFSVNGDSTPVDPSDTTGAVGQFTMTVDENDQTSYLQNTPIDLIDPTQGTTRGTIRGVSVRGGVASLTADSRLALLTVTRQAQPYVGDLEGAFRYYLGLCGITSGIVVEGGLDDIPVTLMGWNGTVWDFIKSLCVAHRVEISLVSNNVVIRPIRQRVAENYRDSDRAWDLDSSRLARQVEVNYYLKEWVTGGLIYPQGGWNPDVPILSVPAGETVTYDIPLNASLVSVVQPTPELFVAADHRTSSVYTVVGNDGLPIPPQQWIDGGGRLSVEIGEDTRSIIVTITGMAEQQYGPYRIALASGTSDFYSTLRIIGTGVVYEQKSVVMETSVDRDRVSQEEAPVIDNFAISSEDDARHIGLWALKSWGSAKHTISVNSRGINRIGDDGSYEYPIIESFNAEWAGQTVEDFNEVWAGKTIAEFNEYWFNSVAGRFENQAFGNIEGARVRERDAMFRIRSGTVSPFGVSYSAEEDTTIADFNEVWAGKTIADFNAEWRGERAQDFSTAPLRRTE